MRWPWSPKPASPVVLSPVEKAVIANGLAVSTRDIGKVQRVKRLATNNGLLACVDAETRARISNALCMADRAADRVLGSSQSQPVPGRHRAARTLKLSTHGGAK